MTRHDASPDTAVFPLLADPAVYDACELDLRVHPDRRAYWLDLYRRHLPGALERAVSVAVAQGMDETAARERAEACRAACLAYFGAREAEPDGHGRLDIYSLACNRERLLREHGFYDAYKLLKAQETDAALSLLPELLADLDGMIDPVRGERVAEGVFAGNIFDVGATATLELVESGELDFHRTRNKLAKRPWLVDHLDDWIARITRDRPYGRAVVFVDNAGCDIVLGMIPFVRDLLKRGVEVVITANTDPALNDITHAELLDLLERVRAMDGTVDTALGEGRLEPVPSGNGASLIDLSLISPELAEAASRKPVDLVVLEGMGRAVESNYNARFTCDALKLAMLKDPDVAAAMNGKLYDLILRFDRV